MLLKRLVVMISGGGSNLQALMDAIESGEIAGEIVGVISSRKDAYGLVRAQEAKISTHVIERKAFKKAEDFDTANLEAIRSYNPDLIVLAGYLSIIGKPVIEMYRNKIINIHPSLIPSFCGKGYYGKKVHEAALAYGVKLSGATTHFVDEGADTGPVIMQRTVPVKSFDTPESLAARVLNVEHEIIVETVALFCREDLAVDGRKVRIQDYHLEV